MITFTFTHVLVCLLGVIGGIVFGAIPGMTATMAVAVFLPLTYAYDIQTCPEDWDSLQLYRRHDFLSLPSSFDASPQCLCLKFQCC